MNSNLRGRINHVDRFKQVYDFSELKFERNITPSDLDFCLDLQGKKRILGEFKSGVTRLPFGQKLSLSRLLKSSHLAGVRTLGFVARHCTNPDEIVRADQCVVSECWVASHGWMNVPGDRKLREFIDAWMVWDDEQKSVS